MKKNDLEKKCKGIRLVISDVDGVLTDGGMYYGENGDELKKFNVRDGVGVVLLQLAGLKVGAFTGENTQMVERRMQKIGMDFLFSNVKDKSACLDELMKTAKQLLKEALEDQTIDVRRLGVKVSELSEMKGQSNIDSYF